MTQTAAVLGPGLDDLDDLFGRSPAREQHSDSVEPDSAAIEPVADPYAPIVLTEGSLVAQVLYQAAVGTPAIVVDSPPGGGKTTTICQITNYLVTRLGQRVTIGVPRRNQARDLAKRLGQCVDPSTINLALSKEAPMDGFSSHAPTAKVEIRTLASLKMSKSSGRTLIVDEAYQTTTEEGAAAAANFEQVIAVGDPGQIGPVVPVATYAWKSAPHAPFAATLRARSDSWTSSLPTTYRLGAATAAAINPLYPFPFDSGRPDTYLRAGTTRLPELAGVQTVSVPTSATDQGLLSAAIAAVWRLVGTELMGDHGVRPIEHSDIVVCAALRSQVTALRAMLFAGGLGQVGIGTADEIQGGQWAAVVAVDPLAGGQASAHHADMGRLCVMASRHTAHLSFVHDGAWRTGPMGELAPKQVRAHRNLRRALTSETLA